MRYVEKTDPLCLLPSVGQSPPQLLRYQRAIAPRGGFQKTLSNSPLKGEKSGSGRSGGPLELLSPARNLECGIAAVDHGADAVYIGAPRFGARAAAGNSVEDIRQLCDYAHKYGVRIYVTLNTLLHEDEREQARLLAWDLYHAGADALIVQDMSLTPVLSQGEGASLPPIPLHASTQMDNRTTEKVESLKALGFNQIVLARELSLEEIRSIHEAVPDVCLEVFVHGALCVSYSGRCYASEYCFGRSANRGECAQFCRLPFSLEDAKGNTLIKDKYLLSLKDMNRLAHLEELMDAGVRSFKIEGRLKDVEYVKNVTASYRQALDAIMKRRPEFVRSSYGSSTYTFQPDLSRSFSRGSTDYFLFGRTDDLASPDTPKSRGREVGRVKEVRKDCIIVSSTERFSNGDGLCYFDEEGHLQGFRVNRAEGNHLYPADPLQTSSFRARLKKGTRLWRSFDKQWEDQMSGKTAERRIAARFLLEETEQGFRLTFSAENGTERSEEFALEHQPARTDQTASIKDVLSKLGDTPYACQEVEIRFSQPWFIPRSTLAEWRREVTPTKSLSKGEKESLTKPQEETPTKPLSKGEKESLTKPQEETPTKPPRGEAFLFSPRGNCPLVAEQLGGALPDGGQKTEGVYPLMSCRFCLRHAWGKCKMENKIIRNEENGKIRNGENGKIRNEENRKIRNEENGIIRNEENGIIRNIGNEEWKEPLYLVLGDGRRFRLEFDCKKCEMSLFSS